MDRLICSLLWTVKNQKKSAPLFFKLKSGSVDREAGVIRNIVIIEEGKDKAGDNWDTTALGQIASLGNAQSMGVKSRFGHPNMCDSALGSYIGRYKDFRIDTVETPEGPKQAAIADLYLDETAKSLPGKGDVYKYILDMAESNSDMFGNSIHYTPDQPARKNEKDDSGNEVVNTYERVKSLIASDLVDSPCATTNLFKDTNDLASKVTEFLEDTPEIFDLIQKDESILNSFLHKYKVFKETQQAMSKEKSTLDKIKEVLGLSVKKSYDAKTADGRTISISDENGDGMPSAGDTVTENGQPVASSTIEMEDGSKITTDASGVVSGVEAKQVEPVIDPQVKSLQDELAKAKSTNDELSKKVTDSEAKLKELTDTLPAIEAEVTKLKSQLSALSGGQPPKEGDQNFRSDNGAPVNRVKQMKEEEEEAKKKQAAAKS